MHAVWDRAKGNRTRWALTAVWLAFTGAYLAFFYLFQDAEEIADASLDGYLEVVLLGLPIVVLLAGRMWLRESVADEDLRPRLVGWIVGTGALFVLTMSTTLFVIETRFDTGERWLFLLMASGFGASAGTITGFLEIRSKQRERERQRSLRAARESEAKRNQLEYLNHYLRHEVLNETQKILGFSTMLAERDGADAETERYLDAIRDSSDEITTFIESIRAILDDSERRPEPSPVDLADVVRDEVAAVRATHPGVTVDVDCPDSARVLAGDLINRVFRNLLENAIEHNGDDLAIEVAVEREGEWIAARVRDDGAGIPDGERDVLFEPPERGDHGYGLFLTDNLVDVYDGELRLEETGPEGTEFVVRFPADPSSSDRADPAEATVAA